MKTLYDIAKVIRSKNAGPFSITLDVLFDSETVYRKVKDSNLINRSLRKASPSWFILTRLTASR